VVGTTVHSSGVTDVGSVVQYLHHEFAALRIGEIRRIKRHQKLEHVSPLGSQFRGKTELERESSSYILCCTLPVSVPNIATATSTSTSGIHPVATKLFTS
jgi:hypothetical protein